MYGTHDGSYYNDDAKSYSTYEKGIDEDYTKNYEADQFGTHSKHGSENGTYVSPRFLSSPNPNSQWSKMEGKN